jgi:hypothetical protein
MNVSSLSSNLKAVALLAAFSSVASAAIPEGWFLAGNRPREYDCSIDPEVSYNEKPATYLKSKDDIKTTGFGTIMQSFDAAAYMGKRVRFSAFVRAEGVKKNGNPAWAALWMRIDGQAVGSGGHRETLGFDNMHDTGTDRSIHGSMPWKPISIVLDVPEGATSISFGMMLAGAGEVWMSGVKFEPVGPEVKVTATPRRPGF